MRINLATRAPACHKLHCVIFTGWFGLVCSGLQWKQILYVPAVVKSGVELYTAPCTFTDWLKGRNQQFWTCFCKLRYNCRWDLHWGVARGRFCACAIAPRAVSCQKSVEHKFCQRDQLRRTRPNEWKKTLPLAATSSEEVVVFVPHASCYWKKDSCLRDHRVVCVSRSRSAEVNWLEKRREDICRRGRGGQTSQ